MRFSIGRGHPKIPFHLESRLGEETDLKSDSTHTRKTQIRSLAPPSFSATLVQLEYLWATQAGNTGSGTGGNPGAAHVWDLPIPRHLELNSTACMTPVSVTNGYAIKKK
jgi:hypothetical protein